jgi:rhodanese-related sulfurtransferase
MKAINADQLKKMLAKDPHPVLVNTLPSEHFSGTKIKESINIPEGQGDFVKRIEEATGGKEKPVIVYCASRQCDSSEKAAQKLEQAGFSEVYDFEEGAEGWKQAGEKLQTA